MEERRSLGGEPKRKGAGKGEAGGRVRSLTSPLALPRSLAHRNGGGLPCGNQCRWINAWLPVCGKSKIKRKKKWTPSPLPRSERARGDGETREHVYNCRPRSRLYFAARFAFRLASRRPSRRARRLVDINDVFISVQVW